MNTATTSTGAPGRLLAACALLLALFLMHGAPSATGCHGAMAAPRALVAVAPETAHHGHSPAPVAVRHGAPSAHPVAGAVDGELCVSTPAHGRTAPVPPSLFAVLALASTACGDLLRGAAGTGWLRRRGPPIAGRALLAQVCVSRT